MRTTIVLDDELVKQAREELGGPSLRAIVEQSLRAAIAARRRQALIEALGTIDLAITEEDLLRERRDKPVPPLEDIEVQGWPKLLDHTP